MQKIFPLLFLLFPFASIAQKGEIPFLTDEKWFFSADISRMLINREPGMAVAYRCNDWLLAELYYGHAFKSFNIIENGGAGASYKYHAGSGEIIKSGIKIASEGDHLNDVRYLGIHLMYKHLYIPTYCNRDGSNGLSGTFRETVSEQRDILKLLVHAGGIQFRWKYLYLEWYAGGGLSLRSRTINKYSFGAPSCSAYPYPPGKYERIFKGLPAIDAGIRFVFAPVSRVKKT